MLLNSKGKFGLKEVYLLTHILSGLYCTFFGGTGGFAAAPKFKLHLGDYGTLWSLSPSVPQSLPPCRLFVVSLLRQCIWVHFPVSLAVSLFHVGWCNLIWASQPRRLSRASMVIHRTRLHRNPGTPCNRRFGIGGVMSKRAGDRERDDWSKARQKRGINKCFYRRSEDVERWKLLRSKWMGKPRLKIMQ